MHKHRGFPSRLPGTDFQFTIRRDNKKGPTKITARERYADRLPKDRTADDNFMACLVEHFGDQVYRTVIPRNVALAEAPSFGQSILKYSKNSRGSMAYLALAGEMLRRDAKQNHYVN